MRAVVKVESNFNPNAVSRKGAMGLMQLMPSTARQLKVKNPFDPEQNVDAGVRHLKQLLESYGGDIKLTLAAYNAGAGAVARSSGVPHYAETQNYVRRITNLYYGGSDLSPGASRDPVTGSTGCAWRALHQQHRIGYRHLFSLVTLSRTGSIWHPGLWFKPTDLKKQDEGTGWLS